MALPSPISDSARPGLLRFPQWGVRGSLFAAFAVIAGLAILISAGAGIVLGHLGGTMTELSGRAKKMKEAQAVTLENLGELIELGADKAVVTALSETTKNIDEMIKSLGTAARERLEAAAKHSKLYNALREAQGDFVAVAAPA